MPGVSDAFQRAQDVARDVARTTDGLTSPDIVWKWADWVIEKYHTSLPARVPGMMLKQVKQIIEAGNKADLPYDSDIIKVGLMYWTLALLEDNKSPSGTYLQDMVFRASRMRASNRAAYLEAFTRLQRQLASYTPGGDTSEEAVLATMSAKTQRQWEHIQQAAQWGSRSQDPDPGTIRWGELHG